MAGYHYKLQIVPKSFVPSSEEEQKYWEFEQPNPLMLDAFRKLLPIENHWGETEEYRSDNNHSVLYIWWEENRVFGIQFEYAPVVKGSDNLLSGILKCCEEYNYNLYSEETNCVVFPSRSELWKDFIKTSTFPIYQRQCLVEFC